MRPIGAGIDYDPASRDTKSLFAAGSLYQVTGERFRHAP